MTYYDSHGGGGGYMNDSQGGTQASPGKSSNKNNTLRPVTIKQILDAQAPDDSTFMIDDAEIGNVTFIAQIRSLADQDTNSTYKMEDGTGAIDVKQFRDKRNAMVVDDSENAAISRELGLSINSYARVTGNVKQFNNKRNITTQSVKPVTDFNEIQCHFLEATAVHLYFTRGAPESQQAKHTGGGATFQQSTASTYAEDTAMGNTAAGVAGASMLPPGTTMSARKIYAFLKSRQDSSEGMHVGMIAQATGVPMGETYKAVDELLSHGVCFTTMDDEHIACMDF
ncbi:replication factor A protein 2 [Orbilia blumenaviensis]|uniref:Replication factor A protein 2 n=1 Tax=Orbilia blumenaviensis TaxID=1796055 RepID=A0AAV9VN04_9PEZI